ncbi:MAG: hypothetical protein RLZ94_1505 [Actinomycetota bacterium]
MTDENSTGGLDRRSFLALGAVATGAVLVPATPALAGRTVRASGPVFTLGVASGDPPARLGHPLDPTCSQAP